MGLLKGMAKPIVILSNLFYQRKSTALVTRLCLSTFSYNNLFNVFASKTKQLIVYAYMLSTIKDWRHRVSDQAAARTNQPFFSRWSSLYETCTCTAIGLISFCALLRQSLNGSKYFAAIIIGKTHVATHEFSASPIVWRYVRNISILLLVSFGERAASKCSHRYGKTFQRVQVFYIPDLQFTGLQFNQKLILCRINC